MKAPTPSKRTRRKADPVSDPAPAAVQLIEEACACPDPPLALRRDTPSAASGPATHGRPTCLTQPSSRQPWTS